MSPPPEPMLVVPVCSTCGRLASWPYCEHRPDRYSPSDPPWCEAIRVTPVDPRGRELVARRAA